MNVHSRDLIDLIAINRRYDLEDSLDRALAKRRSDRPRGKQIYRERAARQHAERMAAATAFKGERT